MAKTKKAVVVHKTQMIPAGQLITKKGNTNKQSRHTFTELRKNIREHGFDETLIVRTVDENSYEVISGNHRYKAGKAEGMVEFPCVVRDDWNEVEVELQSVHRNYSRGKIDKDAFTEQVNMLKKEHELDIGTIAEGMGFEDEDMLADYYREEEESIQKATNTAAAGAVSAPAVRMIDDLGVVISSILEQHGDTVPSGFIVFPAGGKYHMYVQTSPALKRVLETVAERCLKDGLDINIALGGLISIGMSQTDFARNPDKEKVLDAGTEEGEEDLEPIVKFDDI